MDDRTLLDHASEIIEDAAEFRRLVEYIYARPQEVRTDDRVKLRDGRTLSRSTVPVISGNGKVAGRAWYFRDVTEAVRNDVLQRALFRISELSRSTIDIASFYRAVHEVMQTLTEATNFHIAEYDEARNTVTFPYFADQRDAQAQSLLHALRETTYAVVRTADQSDGIERTLDLARPAVPQHARQLAVDAELRGVELGDRTLDRATDVVGEVVVDVVESEVNGRPTRHRLLVEAGWDHYHGGDLLIVEQTLRILGSRDPKGVGLRGGLDDVGHVAGGDAIREYDQGNRLPAR